MASVDLTADEAHVVLDAIAELRAAIDSGRREPWTEYEGSDDDPKTSHVPYRQLLIDSARKLEGLVSLPD